MKRESIRSALLRKKQADDEFDRDPSDDEDDNGLFVSDDGPAIPRLSDIESDNEPAPKKRKRQNDDSDEERPAKKRGKAKSAAGDAKKGKKVLGTNYNETDVEDVIQRAREQTTTKASVQAKKPVPAKQKGREGRAKGPTMTNVDTLFGNDVFHATAATAGLATQPSFDLTNQSKRRDNALAQLIASVPEESTNVAKADRRYLENAIKDFTGHASVTPAPDGNWWVKGMKVCARRLHEHAVR